MTVDKESLSFSALEMEILNADAEMLGLTFSEYLSYLARERLYRIMNKILEDDN